jgi:hypothetical protein
MMQCVTAASGFVASYQFLVKHQRYLTCCTLALPKAVTRRPCLPAQNSLHQLIANKMCELQQFCKEDHVLECDCRTHKYQYISSKMAVRSRQALVVCANMSGPVDLQIDKTQPGSLLRDKSDP